MTELPSCGTASRWPLGFALHPGGAARISLECGDDPAHARRRDHRWWSVRRDERHRREEHRAVGRRTVDRARRRFARSRELGGRRRSRRAVGRGRCSGLGKPIDGPGGKGSGSYLARWTGTQWTYVVQNAFNIYGVTAVDGGIAIFGSFFQQSNLPEAASALRRAASRFGAMASGPRPGSRAVTSARRSAVTAAFA